jgi:NAD(P)-dependent dehydrogenase (short-subunit alcohol dehydrogenase family)
LKSFGVRAISIQNDVSEISTHQDLVNKVVAEFGRIDILVNNAGVFGGLPLGQITEADFDRVFNTNAKVSS